MAKQATALQLLSDGRFVLGLGVGIHEPEYVRAGVDYRRRGKLMDEGVDGLRRAWAGPGPAGDDYVQVPASSPIPLWFGGASAAARRRAAAVGDGWVPLFLAPDEYGAALVALRRETVQAGRDPEAVQAGVVVFVCVGEDDQAPERGAQWLSALYRLPPKAFQRHLVVGSPDTCAAALARYADAGARHILVMVAGSPAVEQFGLLRAAFVGAREPRAGGGLRVNDTDVAILGTGMTDMSRRDLTPETMAYEVVHEALGDAGVSAHDLGLVIVGNAMAGRLSDQGCVRGQTWLRKAGISEAAIVNVDNSCAGGSSSLHLATMAASVQDRPVLALGVEKMWTGDRAGTIAGIEDGLPAEYRGDLHERRHADDNPAGSILMGLNNSWAHRLMAEVGATVRQIAAAAVKAFEHAARNPLAQFQRRVTVDEVLASPQVAGLLTRLMCSSFTDGAAALVLAGPSVPAPASAPRIIGSVARSGNGSLDYHDRLSQAAEAAWDAFGFGPGDADLVELHDATAAEELYALESLGFFGAGEAGPATEAGATGIDSAGLVVNPSGGLVGRGHPLGATGLAQVVELATQFRGRAGARQVEGARTGVAVEHGGDHLRGRRVRGHPRRSLRIRRMTGIKITGWGIAVPDKVVTNEDMAVNLDTSDAWIVERTGIRERHIGGTTSGLAIEAAVEALARAGRTAEEIDNLVLATTTPDGIIPGRRRVCSTGSACAAAPSTSTPPARASSTVSSPWRASSPSGRAPSCWSAPRRSRSVTDMDDRKIAIIVGDGAGAVVVEPVDGPGSLISWNMNSDGSLRHLLKCEHGGTLFMDGKEVFRRAVRVVVESSERAMADAGLGPDDITLMVPHQANLRIIRAACERLGIPEERTAVVIDRYGNTSSASIPLALYDSLEHGRVSDGDHLLLTGFGGGMTWASASSAGAHEREGRAADPALVVLAAGRARRYGGCKPLAPVGPQGEAVIDLVASDALAAGFGTIVLVLGPSTGPAIRYHVEHTWPGAVDVRFATQPEPLGTVHAVVSASDHVGDTPYGVCNADDIYGAAACAQLAAHLGAHDDVNALVGYRLADAVIGSSAVTRGICRVGEDGTLLGVDERRQVTPTPDGGFVAADGREPAVLSPDARVSMNLWGFTAAFHKALRVAMDSAVDASEESEVLLPEVVAASWPPAPSSCCRPRAAASG